MKTTLFLIFVIVTAVQANSLAQRVSLSAPHMKMEDFFAEISRQTKHRFFYSSEVARTVGDVQVDLHDASLEDALKSVLDPAKFEFKVIAGTVTINLKDENTKTKETKVGKLQNRVTGTVRSRDGDPLIGASVSVRGTTIGVQTDVNGAFSIVAGADAVLEVRYIGYQVREIAVDNQQAVTIVLDADERALESVEVVATGYQHLDRKLFTGATSRIDAKDAERPGVPDISRMLEGQAAGVSVQNVSGTFGAAPKIRVRGATSLSGDNKPLWVIDGIILEDMVNISNEALSTGDANTLLGSSVAGLNPNDIESLTILKDAAATAMYGARAMNGVIVVTTKRGVNTEGRANVNYSGTFTTYLKPNYNQFDIMNSAEQMSVLLELENKGFLSHAAVSNNRAGGIFTKMYDLMYVYDEDTDSFALKNTPADRLNFLERYTKANTDWFDILFNNSLLQEHSISISTGTDKAQTYISTSYTGDNGQTMGDNVKRFTGNIRQNVRFNDKLSAEMLINGSIRDQRAPGTLTRQSDPVYGSYSRDFDINPYSYALNTSRLITPYDENGDLEYFNRNYAPFNIINELETNYLTLKMIDLKIQGGIRYKILDELTYSVDGAYRYALSQRNHHALDNSNMAGAFRANPNAIVNDDNIFLYKDPYFPNEPAVVVLPEGGFYNTTINDIKNYYFRQNLEYNATFADIHSVNLFGSMEVRMADRVNSDYDGVGYQYGNSGLVNPNYRYFKKIIEGGDPYFGMNYGKDRNAAFMFRGAYNFAERYSINGTFRYDGSNRMGMSRSVRWLPTWNISGAWDLDRESFYPENDYLSSARIRGTYGLVANMGEASNSATLYYNRLTYRPYENEKETAVYISSLANSELTWEKLYEFNLGADLGLFNDEVSLTVDYYNRDIFDLLGAVKTSGVGGQSTKVANYGTMKSKGVEFTVAGYPIRRTDGFQWRTQFNIAYNKNEITELEVNPNIWSLVRAEGAPMEGRAHRGLYSVMFDGLHPQYGYPTYIGTDGTRNEPYVYLQNTTDMAYLKYHGPVDPTTTGGFYNQFIYKGFTLSSLFTFGVGNYIRLQPTFSAIYNDMSSMSKDMVNRWLMTGDEQYTNVPAIIDPFIADNNIVRPNGTTTNALYPYNVYNYSDQRVAKGDFIRFKTLSLSYMWPRELTSKWSISSMQLSLVGNNISLLYSDDKLNGSDPEFFNNGGVAMPIPKQYTLSVKVGF
ncbi:SusC/RagA family TonB-linked outer membrane protein [Sphingobacterium phlebotomi]|nr:SusC/RagA family TonB-linked outer membrane protein [Sphingobacterium phlebotomi]